MIRRSVLSVNESNPEKLKNLSSVTNEMLLIVNKFIDELWEKQDFGSTFVDFKVDTWLSSRMQQCLGKQALEIVKSQRKRKNKTKPILTRKSFNLDSRFVDFQKVNHFDHWIRLSSIGNNTQIRLPAHSHKHFNKFSSWEQKKSIRLIERHDSWYIEVFFEKKPKKIKTQGKSVGVDCGYKELAVTSSGQSLDEGLEPVYEKIARKRQGSKAFNRALVERDNLINQSLNKIKLRGVRELVCEDLVDVKKGSRGKITKKFNNKLQRWSYPKVLRKLQYLTEEKGVLFTQVNPAYTSQKCCSCGVICKTNRNGKLYKCACGNEMDADLNAAINLSYMGVYSLHTSQQ